MINECQNCRCQLPAVSFGFLPHYCPNCGKVVNFECKVCKNYHPLGTDFCTVYGISIKGFGEAKEAMKMAAQAFTVQYKDRLAKKIKNLRKVALIVSVLLVLALLYCLGLRDGVISGSLVFLLWGIFFYPLLNIMRGDMMEHFWLKTNCPDCVYFFYEKKNYRCEIKREKLAEHIQSQNTKSQ